MLFIGHDLCSGVQKSHLKQAINKWEDNRKSLPLEECIKKKWGEDIFIRVAYVSKDVAIFQ